MVVVDDDGDNGEATKPGQSNDKKRKHGLQSKSTKKRTINNARPRNDEERAASRKGNTMYGYVKFPKGPRTKDTRADHLTNFFVPKKSKTVIKSQVKVKPKVARATYRQYDQPGLMKDAMDIGLNSMLTTGGDTKIAFAAISKGCGDVTIPRQTLTSCYKIAKARGS